MQILHPDHRGVDIDAGPDPARTAPVIDLPARVHVAVAGDVAHDLRHRRRAVQVQGCQVRGQGVEEPPDEGRNVLRVLRVAVVDVARRAREVVGAPEHDFARGFEA